jgi:hypothetical protein
LLIHEGLPRTFHKYPPEKRNFFQAKPLDKKQAIISVTNISVIDPHWKVNTVVRLPEDGSKVAGFGPGSFGLHALRIQSRGFFSEGLCA